MKRSVLAAVVASAFLALPMPAQAQDQMPEMTWFTVFTDHVSPHQAMEYEANIKAIVDAMTAAAVQDMQFVTISGPEMGYAYAVPGYGPNDYDAMNANWQAGVEKVGSQKFMDLMGSADRLVDSREMGYLALRPDLSYNPETVGFDPAKPMRHYTLLYVRPGQEMAFEAIGKKYQALYEKHDIDRGWRIYQYMTGSDLPAYMVVESAENEHDHHMINAEIDEVLGAEAQALFAEVGVTLRSVETRTGWVRPDLSYPPMEMTADGE
jgi:hypothetical protein